MRNLLWRSVRNLLWHSMRNLLWRSVRNLSWLIKSNQIKSNQNTIRNSLITEVQISRHINVVSEQFYVLFFYHSGVVAWQAPFSILPLTSKYLFSKRCSKCFIYAHFIDVFHALVNKTRYNYNMWTSFRLKWMAGDCNLLIAISSMQPTLGKIHLTSCSDPPMVIIKMKFNCYWV